MDNSQSPAVICRSQPAPHETFAPVPVAHAPAVDGAERLGAGACLRGQPLLSDRQASRRGKRRYIPATCLLRRNNALPWLANR
jgi:hypothetical protein